MNIKLDNFEGPLDLLLHLIEKAEVDIYEIPIAQITDQYLCVLKNAKVLELDVASDFLVMAATLLSIKSRMLLPPKKQDETEEGEWVDPRHELVERILEYKKFKAVIQTLQEKENAQSEVYSPLPIKISCNPQQSTYESELSPKELLRAYVSVLSLHHQEPQDTPKSHRVEREVITIASCIEYICSHIIKKGQIHFSQLFSHHLLTRERVVVTFLALLELVKQQRIVCKQQRHFTDILIERRI